MGFLSTMGGLAKSAASSVSEMNKKAEELCEEYQYKSDDYLKDKFKSGNLAEKMAATKILKSRGY